MFSHISYNFLMCNSLKPSIDPLENYVIWPGSLASMNSEPIALRLGVLGA